MTAYKITAGLILFSALAMTAACSGPAAPTADQNAATPGQPPSASNIEPPQPVEQSADAAADDARIVELIDRRAEETDLQYDWTFAAVAICRMAEDRKASDGDSASRTWCLAELDRPLEEIVTDWQAGKYGEVKTLPFWTPPK